MPSFPPRLPTTDSYEGYPEEDVFDDSEFRNNAKAVSLPGASGRALVPKVDTYDLGDNKRVQIEAFLTQDGLEITWFGDAVSDGRILWLAVWDPIDDADRSKPPEPRRWFALGLIGERRTKILIEKEFLPRRRGSSFSMSAVLSEA